MNFWTVFVLVYAVFSFTLAAYAAHIALSNVDPERRKDAYKVLKLIWGTATGASGLLALVVRLHEVGVL